MIIQLVSSVPIRVNVILQHHEGNVNARAKKHLKNVKSPDLTLDSGSAFEAFLSPIFRHDHAIEV